MENIVQTNNRDLRLVGVKVGVLSTLRLILPDVPANATRVEAIVTQGDTHTAYTAHLDSATEHWLVDVAAAQFPVCGKQKYEVAYRLDGKQFWDGQGWITVEDATTGGITPSPAPDPARYVVTRINGYGAPNPNGEVRIPRLSVATEDPTTVEGFIEFDQLFNRVTGSLFVLCSVGGTLTWVQTAGGGGEGAGRVLMTHKGSGDASLYDEDGEAIYPNELFEKLNAGYSVFFRGSTEYGQALYTLGEITQGGSAWFYCVTHGKIVSLVEVNTYGWVQDPVSFPVEPVGVNLASGQNITLHGNEYVYLTGAYTNDATIRFDRPTDELTFLVHAAQSVNNARIVGDSIEDRFVWKAATNPVAGSVKLSDFAGSLTGWKRINIRRFRTTGGYNLYHLEAN